MWMGIALEEADRASAEGEVPVGCVIRGADGDELARSHNQREQLRDATAHAEVVAIRRAAKKAGAWRLPGSTLYVTLEPCVMCAGALVQARVARVVYGCDDAKGGAVFSLYELVRDPRLNHQLDVTRGVMQEAATARMQTFFARLRRAGKK
jgi:tRNA(adenine34) deaminase